MKNIGNKNIKILYQMPFLETLSAGRTIYNGYKNAFENKNFFFLPLTSNDNFAEIMEKYNPDIFITSTSFYFQKFIDFDLLNKYRKKGLFVFANIGFWNSPINKLRINEGISLSDDKKTTDKIKNHSFADSFFCTSEQDDQRMEGFTKYTGYEYHTIPLAADRYSLKYSFDDRFKADISFIGTNLPQKKDLFQTYLFPLKRSYDLKLYGQDWTFTDKTLGIIQKIGQFYNIEQLKHIRKSILKLSDEGKIYKSSLISVNIHEDYQRQFGKDCNERTFKIPFCEGFQITDNVECIKKYFKPGEEVIIAENKNDWFDKIEYYIKNPEKRIKIIEKGKLKVEKEHTYDNRVESLIKIYEDKKNNRTF